MSKPFCFTVLTIFPEMFSSFLSASILGRARNQGLLDVRLTDIRPYSASKHHNTDDYPFGGGAGMVMMAQPIMDAMEDVMKQHPGAKRIYLGPRGRRLTTEVARELSREKELILLCGHYEGVDQRALDTCVDEEISIGDYVLTGGETAAIVVIDAVARLVPGVLPNEEAYTSESHTGNLLEAPEYTMPAEWNGVTVPEGLRNGNDAVIAEYNHTAALLDTLNRRPDLFDKEVVSEKDWEKMLAFEKGL